MTNVKEVKKVWMQPPHGPRPISPKGQVNLPAEVLKACGLTAGDQVYLLAHDDPPGSVLIVPIETAVRWFEQGKQASGTSEPRA